VQSKFHNASTKYSKTIKHSDDEASLRALAKAQREFVRNQGPVTAKDLYEVEGDGPAYEDLSDEEKSRWEKRAEQFFWYAPFLLLIISLIYVLQ
jgi:hypothetical protein